MNSNVSMLPNGSQQHLLEWILRNATAPPPSTAGTIAANDRDLDEETPLLPTRRESPRLSGGIPGSASHTTNRFARWLGTALSAVRRGLGHIGTFLLYVILAPFAFAFVCLRPLPGAFVAGCRGIGKFLLYIVTRLLYLALFLLALALAFATLYAVIYGAVWSVNFGASVYGVIGGIGAFVAYVFGICLAGVFCVSFCDSCCDG